MKAKDVLHKEVISEHYGKVYVENIPKGKTSVVEVKVLQRGKGWNDDINQYLKYKRPSVLQEDGSISLQWGYTHNDEYGKKDIVHIKTLKQLES